MMVIMVRAREGSLDLEEKIAGKAALVSGVGETEGLPQENGI